MDNAATNAKIAEKIFGWRRGNGQCMAFTEAFGWHHPSCKCPDVAEMKACSCVSDPIADELGCTAPCTHWHNECGALPDFCGNADASKMLREKLAELGYTWILVNTSPTSYRLDLFTISRVDGLPETLKRGPSADNEFLAIAKCALMVAEGM